MARSQTHPRAEPHLWPVVIMGIVLALQVILLQVAVNRLTWGQYAAVFAPAVATMGLSLVTWFLYRHLDQERL